MQRWLSLSHRRRRIGLFGRAEGEAGSRSPGQGQVRSSSGDCVIALSPAETEVQAQIDAATPNRIAVLVRSIGLCRNQDRMDIVR